MAEYRTDVDIANRALQHVGASRIVAFTDDSKNASETQFCYGKLRQAELRENTWTFACKRAMLRAIDSNTMLLDIPLWSNTTTYFVGSIVNDQFGTAWISRVRDNLNNDPLLTAIYWEPYFGPLSVSLYTTNLTYHAGELVYTTVGDGTVRVYMSLQNNNADNPATATAYDATVTYFKNQVVTSVAIPYMSLTDFNRGNTPASSPSHWTSTFVGGRGSIKWLQVGGAEFPFGVGLVPMNIIYPLGEGPTDLANTRNIYKLPAGFLDEASQYPGAGVTTYLGAPSGLQFSDWVHENGFLLTNDIGPIPYRFVADITDVSRMDAMFCEGLAARVALTVCETLTQSTSKLGMIAKVYDVWIGRAKTKNAIEQGVDVSPDDDFVSCRL